MISLINLDNEFVGRIKTSHKCLDSLNLLNYLMIHYGKDNSVDLFYLPKNVMVHKKINGSTSQDIILRMMSNERTYDEDTPVYVIELYIC